MTGSKSRARTRPRVEAGATSPPANTGSGSGGAPGGKAASGACAELAEIVILMSPDPTVLVDVKPDDQLVVARQGRSVVVLYQGRIAGSIVATDLIRLISCLEHGFKFTFTVLTVSGGRCEGALRCVGR